MNTASRSLRSYLITRLLWFMAPVLLAMMAVHWHFERKLLLEVFDDSLRDEAKILATLVTRKGARLELEFADEYMPQYSRAEAPMYFQIRLADGALLESSVSLGDEDLPARFGPLEAPESFWADLPGAGRVRAVGLEFPLRLGTAAGPEDSVAIVVAADRALLASVFAKGNAETLITGLLAAGGIAAVVLLAMEQGLRSLQRTSEKLADLTPDSRLHPIDLEATPREIRPVAERMNSAMHSIQVLVDRERRFNANVAHELRTPLAELRTSADVALKWPDDHDLEATVRECREIALQMEALVEGLLQLSQLEAATEFETHAFDLADLVAKAVNQAEGSATAGRSLQLESPEHLVVDGSPILWEVVVRNLIDNAVEYSTEGAVLRVGLRASAEGIHFEVENAVEGFDAEMATRCTDRLWRKDGQGAVDHHFGLGLSIVEAAAELLSSKFVPAYSNGVFSARIVPAGFGSKPATAT